MSKSIFVNLPVKDLKKSMDFFGKLGFTFHSQFTDETAACMVISENIFTMLLTEKKFSEFSPRAICDTSKTTEVLIALDQDSKEAVIEMVKQAVAAGGTLYADPKDHGFMYQHGFQDLDGHIWEVFFMDPSVVQKS